jgi:hypothetical protein
VAVLPAVRGGADAGPGTRVPALRAGASPICNLSLPDRDSQIVRHPTRHRIIGARGPTGTAWCELRSADAAPSFDAGVCGWRPCRYEVIDRRLAEQQGDGGGAFIAGSAYTIADIALYPWCAYHQWAGVSLEGLPHLSRWIEALGQREGVRRGLGHNPKPIAQLLADADAIRATVGATTLDKVGVSRPFPSWNRSILTEIYLCHACSCHEILRTATAGQDAAERRIREQLSSKGWASAYEHSYDPHWAAKNHSVDQIVFRGAPPEISLRFHAVCPRSWTSHRPRSVPTEVYLRFQAATSRRAPAASTTSAARLRRRTLCVVLSGSVLFCSSQRARAVLLAPLAQRRVLTARWSTHRGVSIVCSVVASD